MRKLVLVGALILGLLPGACGEPEIVTVETLTREFCDGVIEMVDRPADERAEKFQELNSRIDAALQKEGVDDEALAFNILGECGEELILMGAPD